MRFTRQQAMLPARSASWQGWRGGFQLARKGTGLGRNIDYAKCHRHDEMRLRYSHPLNHRGYFDLRVAQWRTRARVVACSIGLKV